MEIPKNILTPLTTHLESLVTPERLERMKAVLAQRTRYVCVVLENIFQPHNASAVVRSCECFGIQDLHIIENSYQFERTRGVSMGADKWLNLSRYNRDDFNTPECLNELKSQGYKIAAMTLRPGAVPLHELSLDKPVALTFGTEQEGLTEEAHALADQYVYLPMYGFTQSFNISVSCALSLQILRERIEREKANWPLTGDEAATLKFTWLRRSIRAADDIITNWLAENAPEAVR